MQRIYRRIPISISLNLPHIFGTPFYKNAYGEPLLKMGRMVRNITKATISTLMQSNIDKKSKE